LHFGRLFRGVLPCFFVCTLVAAAAVPSEEPPEASSSWMKTLWNLPLLRHFAPTPPVPKPVRPLGFCRVEPLPDVVDAEAIQFERIDGPDTTGLLPAMAQALDKFRSLVAKAGGTVEVRSAYRPPAYQEHLQAVWFKWMRELRRNREAGCQPLRMEVSEEFKRHHLLESQMPVTSSDHTRGLAFDATVVMPRVVQKKKRRVSVDRLASLAGLRRPDIRHDPVHYKLILSVLPSE
jgi:hypothetical protein